MKAEGSLVETNIGSQRVIYQVLSGLTKEEIVERKILGYALKARARKIGIWNGAKNNSNKFAGYPQMNILYS